MVFLVFDPGPTPLATAGGQPSAPQWHCNVFCEGPAEQLLSSLYDGVAELLTDSVG